MPKNYEFDAVIVGSSVSGAAAAALLAKSGAQVALIERNKFPRRKICGEGLSGVAMPILQQLGVYEEILKLPHHPIEGYTILDNGSAFDISPKLLHGPKILPSFGIERRVFDDALLKFALRQSNVTYFPETKAELISVDRYWQVKLEDVQLSSPLVVAADGAQSTIAATIDNLADRNNPLRYGISFVAEGSFARPLNRVTIVPGEKFELFFTPVAANRLNIAVLFDKQDSLPWRTGDSDQFSDFVRFGLNSAARHLGFVGECVDEPLGAGPISMARRLPFKDNVFFVGDACTTFDPIGGMGMAHALHSSALAAQAIQRYLKKDMSLDGAGLQYSREHAHFTFRLRQLTKLSYWSLKHPWGKSLRRALVPHKRHESAVAQMY